MDHAKRKLFQAALFGAGSIGLRAFATGLPLGLLARPRLALADTSPVDGGIICKNPQYLILSTSGGGDPLNANVPGTYDDPGVYHSGDGSMAKTAMTVGGKQVYGAATWASMPQNILDRTSFIHHATYTNSHGDAPKVNRYMGAVKDQEMLVSLIAKNTASCLGAGGDAGIGGTVQPQPVVLSNDLITFSGAVLPPLNPPNLQAVLTGPGSALLQNLQALRDKDLDSLNALFKQTGTAAQRAILDQYALSQSQVRNINQQILSDLSKIQGTQRQDYNIAASVLIRLNVSPVIVMSYSFGGDNHGDNQLQGEARETVASVGGIQDLYNRLKSYGLQDQTTMLFQNVFGRTLSTVSHSNNADGRNHNANHHCTVVIGSTIKGSVIGGIKLNSSSTDYQAMGFDSTSGAADDNGDIDYNDTFAAVGKTIGTAVGVDASVLNAQIMGGAVIPAALNNV